MNNSYNDHHPSIKVIIEQGDAIKKEYHFNNSICIGRDEECDIQLKDGVVSRKHLELSFVNSEWWINDNNSRNGTYIDGHKVDREKLNNKSKVMLGKDGPLIVVTIEQEKNSELYSNDQDSNVNQYIDHYFSERKSKENMGEHTMMVRQAYEVVKKKHSSKYIISIICIAVIALSIAVYAIYQQSKVKEQKKLAEKIFYDMKSLEIELLKLSETEKINQLKKQQRDMGREYDQFINELGINDVDEETKIIFRIARVFGECEVNIPSDFIGEVKNYINFWKSTSRFINALNRAKLNGYNDKIVNTLAKYNLPHQYYYLALQESNFKPKSVGSPTRSGYAKGIWQFIPGTAIEYGLKVGPLADTSLYDPHDERFNFAKATDAAARYLNDIYDTEAQASGLLVAASYNWGVNNVRRLVRKMILELPKNPRERNFWRLLESNKNKIPNETYNYVFYIFSAAVIGEDPRLFGFDFDNPLSDHLLQFDQ